jgi:ATP synthase protein I
MKQETRQAWRELAFFSSLGLSVALSIFIGLGIGVFLDRYFDTSPWLMLIFMVLGIAAGFATLGWRLKRAVNSDTPVRPRSRSWKFRNAY